MRPASNPCMQTAVTYFLACLWLFICAGSLTAADRSDSRDTVTVFAASSLISALEKVPPHGTALSINHVYGPSAALARQIAHGAPADIFLSANRYWTDFVTQEKALGNQAVMIAGNALVLVLPAGTCTAQQTPLDVLRTAPRLAIANPETAPAGQYARTYLKNTGLWDAAQRKLAFGHSVRQTLLYAERGGMAAIVYSSDAQNSRHICTVGSVPEKDSGPVRYFAALVSDTPAARQYLDYLQSASFQTILVNAGFISVPK